MTATAKYPAPCSICGATVMRTAFRIRQGAAFRCEKSECVLESRRRHGMRHGLSTVDGRHTKEFRAWVAARKRCYNPNNPRYSDYGGRGIRMCDRWLDSFQNFHSDMGPSPGRDYSLDRIDVNGNYEPGNCRWATHAEQVNNARSNRRIELNGKNLTVGQWSRLLNLHPQTIYSRLNIGCSPADALRVGPESAAEYEASKK